MATECSEESVMKVDPDIRKSVVASLPEAEMIENEILREKVFDAWALSLEDSGYTSIEQIPMSAVPDAPEGKGGTQANHLRGVARIAASIARELSDAFDEIEIDMDEVVAGGLCHDLGKPFEYSASNRNRWAEAPERVGKPSIRHTVYGVHVALNAGLPESIAHIAGAHSKEGEHIERSLAAEIVHHADHAFWRVLDKAGFLDRGDFPPSG
jgi:putative nucleotidyltransferase with HDIG domain